MTRGSAERKVHPVSDRPIDTPEWHDETIEQFRKNNGTVRYYGRILVLLHHRGARTGVERITPVVGVRDSDDWIIAASRRGARQNPAWFHNVLAQPDVEIETPDDGVLEMRATRLLGNAWDEAWERFTSLSPVFAEYQAGTDRVIPIFRLTHR